MPAQRKAASSSGETSTTDTVEWSLEADDARYDELLKLLFGPLSGATCSRLAP